MAAIFFYLAFSGIFTQTIHQSVLGGLKLYLSPANPLFSFALMSILLLPQLLIAVLGGWLNNRYQFRLQIERRCAANPDRAA